MTPSRTGPSREILVISAILLLAAFLRFYRLDQLPPGLHYDEAFKGVEARKVLAGTERPIFFAENFGELPLRTYATALNFALFGESAWSLRLVSAFAGILMIAALYSLARDLFRSKWIAALAAFALTILYWQLNFSRMGMEPILTPLMLTLALVFLWRGLRSRRSLSPTQGEWKIGAVWFALSGFSLGATFYTYQAALFVPVLIVAFAILEFLVNRPFWKRHLRGLAILTVTALIAVAPLGLYFAMHPAQLIQRPNDVAVASSDTVSLVDNALRVAGMFFLRGDANPRSNLPFRPALDPFLAIGFIAGMAACILRIRRRESRLLLLWLVIMVLPSVLTEFAPHFGRSIAVIPALAILVAVGFGWLFKVVPAPRWALAAVLVAGLGASTYSTIHDYFFVWGSDPGLFDSFDTGYLSLAQKLHDRPADETIYISPVDAQNYTVQFGLNGREARSFEGRHVLVLPPPGTAAAFGVVTREDSRTIARLKALFPLGQVVQTIWDLNGRPYAIIFRAEGAPQIAIQKPVRARLGDKIVLLGYDLMRGQVTIGLTVQWASIAEAPEDYTVFVHLIGPMNPENHSLIWAQDDAQPGRGSYPTSRWQAGEVIIDEYRLTMPAGAPAGDYQIELGMYNVKTGARLAATDANGTPLDGDRILLENVTWP